MRLDTFVNGLIDEIKNDSYFSDMKIVNAYSALQKPTRLSRVYIALGVCEISLEKNHIDFTDKAGDVSVFADIFVPLNSDFNVSEIFSRLCKVLNYYNISSIKAQTITSDRDIEAILLKTVFTFSDEISFGGDEDE